MFLFIARMLIKKVPVRSAKSINEKEILNKGLPPIFKK
jgi:hypothetical protein